MQGEVLSELAVKYLRDFALSPVPHAVYLVEDETKDAPMDFKSYYEANQAWDELLWAGLITDRERAPWLAIMEEKTGRNFRMFHLTEYGRVMDNLDLYVWDNDKGATTWRPKNLH
jgi:hypothetical protein